LQIRRETILCLLESSFEVAKIFKQGKSNLAIQEDVRESGSDGSQHETLAECGNHSD
jgi:hypothetical protein